MAVTGGAPQIRRDTRSYTRDTSSRRDPAACTSACTACKQGPGSDGHGRSRSGPTTERQEASRDAPGLRDPDKQRPPEGSRFPAGDRNEGQRPDPAEAARCPRPGQRTEADSGTGPTSSGPFASVKSASLTRLEMCPGTDTAEQIRTRLQQCQNLFGCQSSQRHRSRSRRPLASNSRPSFSSSRRCSASPPLRDRL